MNYIKTYKIFESKSLYEEISFFKFLFEISGINHNIQAAGFKAFGDIIFWIKLTFL